MFRRAFTLIELIIVIGLMTLIMAIFIPGYLRQHRQTELSETIAVLISDIKSQQIKAMSGISQSGSTPQSYSVWFNTDSYTLFPGSVYNPTDPANYSVPIEPDQEFAGVTLPSSQITFAPGSGEVSNFTQPNYVFSLIDNQNNLSYTLTINAYGAITQLD